MPEQITTAAELDSLPIGSVVMTETHRGFGGGYEQRVWVRHGGQGSPLIHDWQSTDGGFQRVGEPEHARGMWAVNRNVTVLYRPDAPPVIPGQNPGKPTAETVADALIRYETGGCCGFGTTCGLCDCGRSTDDAATRWLRNYHGSIDSTALLLAFRAGQKAAQPDGESSWIGDHKRLRELAATAVGRESADVQALRTSGGDMMSDEAVAIILADWVYGKPWGECEPAEREDLGHIAHAVNEAAGEIATIGDLTIRHLGRWLTIPGLISPLLDYDPEALVSVEGTLLAITYVGVRIGGVPVVRVKLTDWIGALPLNHPCQLWEKPYLKEDR